MPVGLELDKHFHHLQQACRLAKEANELELALELEGRLYSLHDQIMLEIANSGKRLDKFAVTDLEDNSLTLLTALQKDILRMSLRCRDSENQ